MVEYVEYLVIYFLIFSTNIGMVHKALDLAFKTQQYDALQQMTADLDSHSDPALVQKCADYFIENQQYDKAVDLLAVAKKVTNITPNVIILFTFLMFSVHRSIRCMFKT